MTEGVDSERGEFERELSERGVPIALSHRPVWAAIAGARDQWFVRVRDQAGRGVCGFAVQVHGSRALPGHWILRSERFGAAVDTAAAQAGILALTEVVRSRRRVLRLELEVLSRDPCRRAQLRSALAAAGFRQRPRGRSYAYTPVVDLTPGEEEIFAGLHSTARRHIRGIRKHPVTIRVISDGGRYGARMNDLLRETMLRTGGEYRPIDWEAVTALCERSPGLARLVGLFRTDVTGPEALVSYALGYAHGDHVEYSTAASVRVPDLKMPLSYALAWELIVWAKQIGASWFDFGGVAVDDEVSEQATSGIADFKRYFTNEITSVGEEWWMEPSPFRSSLAGGVSHAAAMWRRLRVGEPAGQPVRTV